jgi:hypothetical protein
MNDINLVASLISDDTNIPPTRLLQKYLDDHAEISYEPFRDFCAERGMIVEGCEFLDLLAANETHTFQEYSDQDGRHWVPVLSEGYVSNSLPSELDDFGDDQIDGITKPIFGSVTQPDTTDFGPLVDVDEENDDISDLPGLDTPPKHRPSRNPAELECFDMDGITITEQDNPLIASLYKLVGLWQDGEIDKQTFEWRVRQMAAEQPTLQNHCPDIWAMVRRIVAAKARSSTKV